MHRWIRLEFICLTERSAGLRACVFTLQQFYHSHRGVHQKYDVSSLKRRRGRRGVNGYKTPVYQLLIVFVELFRFITNMIGAVFKFFYQAGNDRIFGGRRYQFDAVSVFFQKADMDFADFVICGRLRDFIPKRFITSPLFGLFTS